MKSIKLLNIINELEINKPIVMYPFRNNSYEKGLNIADTIKNFIRANPFQPEKIIVDSIAARGWYFYKYIEDNIRPVLNQGVVRKQVINPKTKRKIWVYYIPQGSLFELEINNPRVTAEKVEQYYLNNIFKNSFEFEDGSNGWEEYKQICKPYCEKYDIYGHIRFLYEFKKLSQQELINLFNEMRQLVKKHVGKEILNELEINNPLVTAEKAKQYYIDNIIHNNIEFEDDSKGWYEYKQICEPYCKKYNIIGWIGLSDFEKLSQSDLTKFYNEMRKLIQKRVGK